jgi:triosephosphate isomerase (TIM)
MKRIIVANWKMNPQDFSEAKSLFASTEYRMHLLTRSQVIVCPPFIYLLPLVHHAHLANLGAQNMNWEEQGAMTGEISVGQLKLVGVDYVILGHSERRLFLGETDVMVNLKIATALKNKIVPIVCLGGSKDATKADMKKLVTQQFESVANGLEKKQLEKIIFVYEPIWAISTMKNSIPATGVHAREMILYIRTLLAKKIGKEAADVLTVLYGGTVNKNNVQEFAQYPEIDGALVGAASLDPDNFWAVISEFDKELNYKIKR